jgi:hypothetical protein
MSHQSFAAIWIELQTRTDIDNILCELIGRNSLESSVLATDSDELLDSSLRLTVSVKAIFDLQRTYSQCSRPSGECPHLLRPRQLFLAILYLLRIKSRVFCRSEDTSTQYVAKRSFVAQTLVSGLRALWFRMHSLSRDEITQLRSMFEEAWDGDELYGLDKFLIRTLCRMILEELSDPQPVLIHPACGEVKLRDYSTGLVSALAWFEAITRLITVVSFRESPRRISHTCQRGFIRSSSRQFELVPELLDSFRYCLDY